MMISTLSGTAKRIFLLLVIAAIIGGVGYAWTQRIDNNDGVLRLYGNVDIREVQLAFRQPGRVSAMLFDEGDAVTRGTRMATLDAQPYQEALASAQATVQIAQAELAKLRSGLRPQEVTQAEEQLKQAQAIAVNTERDYQRQYSLLASGASSRQTVDASRAARDQAVAGVASAKAGLSLAIEGYREEDIAAAAAHLTAAEAARAQAETALADTALLAPSNGIIIARIREPGSMVTSQSTIYNLSLHKPVYVRAYVREPDLGRIAPGTAVRVKSDSGEKIYHGQIGFISPRAEFTPKTVETADLRTDLVYRLRIVIDETDGDEALRQGMPVTIEVDTIAPSGAHMGER